MVDKRRTSSIDIRHNITRVKGRVPPAETEGSEDMLGRSGDMPSGRTSLGVVTECKCGSVSQAEKVAKDSLGRIRFYRAPNMKYKDLLGPIADCMDRTLA